MGEFDPVFNPPGCQVEAVAPIDALPEIVCELPDPELSPIRDCYDPIMPPPATGGSPGPQGPTGYPGPRGYDGPPGSRGAPGSRGNKGAPGAPGGRGTQGPQGAQGPPGPPGPRGPQGPAGFEGQTGGIGWDGPPGPKGPMGYQGDKGYTGIQGDTGPAGAKMAIVPYTVKGNTQYLGLSCVEMPEAYFSDLLRVTLTADVQRFWLDPVFVDVCEAGTLKVTSLIGDASCLLGGNIVENVVEVRAEERPARPVGLVIEVSGLRKGHTARFPRFTEEQMRRNNEFWSQPFRH